MYSYSIPVNIIFFFVVSAIFSLILINLLKKKSVNFSQKKIARQVNLRWGNSNKSHLGGLTFSFCAFLASIIIIFQNTFILGEITEEYKSFIGIVFTIIISSIAGLLDEKENLMPLTKLFFQFIIVAVLLWSGYVIPITDTFVLNVMFTIFWIILVINALNMFDNVDGAAGLFSLITLTFLLIICLFENANINFIVLISSYLGSIIIFLLYNFYPSKIFMGDIGSLQLASIISAVSIKFLWQQNNYNLFDEKIYFFLLNNIIFIIIFLDVFLVTIFRLINKKNPFVGDTNHLSHALINITTSPRVAVLILSGLSLISCLISFSLNYLALSSHLSDKLFYLILSIIFFTLLLTFLYFKGLSKNK